MTKKIFIVTVLFSLLVSLYFYLQSRKLSLTNQLFKTNSTTVQSTPSPSIINNQYLINNSIFIPYWSLPGSVEQIKSPINNNQYAISNLIYFGVVPITTGIDKNETGYKKLKTFSQITARINQEKWLTLRMTNTDVNLSIINDQDSWEKITSDVLDIVKTGQFSGVVLDLEISVLPTDKIVSQINNFVQYISTQLEIRNLKLEIILYGDTFYRKRPFDVKQLANFADEIMIMAYDFHKANGEPGPNFPLEGKEKYDYDLKTAIDDFSTFIPSDKLTVVFGMYGYDWTVDEKKRPIKKASSLTLNQIKDKFLNNCPWKNCLIVPDEKSAETEINYLDEGLNYHVVWFEDEQSVKRKQEFLKTRGITNFVYWAYDYY